MLDIGCGFGANGKSLLEKFPGVEIYGVDIIPKDAVPDFIQYQKVDLNKESLPFPDNYFSTIIFTHVIEHLESESLVGREIGRVLKPGGEIYIEAPNWTSTIIPSFGIYRDQHGPFNFYDDPTHIKPCSKHRIFAFLSQYCMLEDIHVGTVRNWLKVLLDPIIILVGILSKNRSLIVGSIWNISGWCVYGTARKK